MTKKQKPREPVVPAERHETIRKEILHLLTDHVLSAKELSAQVHISEKDVYDHLEHIERSTHTTAHRFTVMPAVCSKCGFIFKKRDRLRKPGKCPICHSEKIEEPAYTFKEAK